MNDVNCLEFFVYYKFLLIKNYLFYPNNIQKTNFFLAFQFKMMITEGINPTSSLSPSELLNFLCNDNLNYSAISSNTSAHGLHMDVSLEARDCTSGNKIKGQVSLISNKKNLNGASVYLFADHVFTVYFGSENTFRAAKPKGLVRFGTLNNKTKMKSNQVLCKPLVRTHTGVKEKYINENKLESSLSIHSESFTQSSFTLFSVVSNIYTFQRNLPYLTEMIILFEILLPKDLPSTQVMHLSDQKIQISNSLSTKKLLGISVKFRIRITVENPKTKLIYLDNTIFPCIHGISQRKSNEAEIISKEIYLAVSKIQSFFSCKQCRPVDSLTIMIDPSTNPSAIIIKYALTDALFEQYSHMIINIEREFKCESVEQKDIVFSIKKEHSQKDIHILLDRKLLPNMPSLELGTFKMKFYLHLLLFHNECGPMEFCSKEIFLNKMELPIIHPKINLVEPTHYEKTKKKMILPYVILPLIVEKQIS